MKANTASGLVACILFLCLIIGTPLEPSFAAKPAPPPPLPPIRYQIQYWDVPNPGGDSIPQSMNNYGQVVGWYTDPNGEHRGYLYDPALLPALAFDLSDLIGGSGVPAGSKINSAKSINKHGVLVGNLSSAGVVGSPDSVQAFVLDLNAAVPAVVQLPNWGGWDYFSANWINDNGDIVGTYQNADGTWGQFFYNPNIPATPLFLPGAGQTSVGGRGFLNNQAQVGGNLNDANSTPYRWMPLQGSVQTFPGLTNAWILGINDSGMMCGYTDVTTTTGSGRNTTTTTNRYPMRLATLPANILTAGGAGNSARAINSTADVLISSGKIYRDDWAAYGYYVDLNKLVVGSSTDVQVWNAGVSKTWWYMNNRGATSNAGQIMGTLWLDSNTGRRFLLNPVPAP